MLRSAVMEGIRRISMVIAVSNGVFLEFRNRADSQHKRCTSISANECVRVVLMLFASSQQANGPRAADGRDSPVQETESR